MLDKKKLMNVLSGILCVGLFSLGPGLATLAGQSADHIVDESMLHIEIHGIPTTDGHILYQLMPSDSKDSIHEGEIDITEGGIARLDVAGLEPGAQYWVRYFHDENDNEKLDTNLIGIPKEDYGFSNNARGFMGPPKREKCLFTYTSGMTLEMRISGS